MSIVTGQTQPEEQTLLEVVVLHPRDAAAATDGGADRLLFLVGPEDVGRSPDPAAVSAVVRETSLPVRVLLRVEDGYAASAEGLRRLAGLAGDLRQLGADSFSFGFLDHDLEIDRAACAALATEVGTAWGFHRGFDAALEPGRAWRDVVTLPGIDAVASAGSSRGMAMGGDELTAYASALPEVARLVLASGGLVPDQVPWLVRAGVRQFGIGASARQDGSWTKAYVDPGRVRAWRMLLDDALSRALGIPVD
ncbi:copper homeostasis protein CutC [Nocardioides terrisoli]|uniref:copper homeostasis protein CutC n=1 Tax=Nocardioides terrisoli TaxID=3388267 RepID=UPI00287B89C8|nr:copper homeostasis protein CutC [Nocardioides marmorisolisilvae]